MGKIINQRIMEVVVEVAVATKKIQPCPIPQQKEQSKKVV
jgi:hypothetical protein